MSEVQMSDDNEIEYDEVDMGEVGKIADVTVDDVDVSRAGISDFIDAIQNKSFTSAEKQFNDMVDDRMQAALNQAKLDVANRIYNNEPEEEENDVEN